jgi:hypothetical protein
MSVIHDGRHLATAERVDEPAPIEALLSSLRKKQDEVPESLVWRHQVQPHLSRRTRRKRGVGILDWTMRPTRPMRPIGRAG